MEPRGRTQLRVRGAEGGWWQAANPWLELRSEDRRATWLWGGDVVGWCSVHSMEERPPRLPPESRDAPTTMEGSELPGVSCGGPVCGRGHVYVCSEHVCKGAQARSRNAVITAALLRGKRTQAPPASGRQTPPPAGSTSLSGLKKAGGWPRGLGRRQQCVRDGNSQPAQPRVVLKGE